MAVSNFVTGHPNAESPFAASDRVTNRLPRSDAPEPLESQDMTQALKPLRDPAPMLDEVIEQWGGHHDLWVFAYGSLIWKPDFDFVERRPATVHGWHRALKMWSRVNRGTPERPGLVFGMLSGGCCRGMVYRIPKSEGRDALVKLWGREMVLGVYDPRWLPCKTPQGNVTALAFTLSRKSPSHTGELTADEYRAIFTEASGIYGTTLDYAHRTLEELKRHNIHDRHLERLLKLIERE